MAALPTQESAPPRWVLVALAALCLGLFFLGLGAMPLLDPDESRHAEVAREMEASGDWIIPSFNGETYFEKPAGFYWLVAGAYRLFGISEWSARLPSAAFAVVGVAITFFTGARLYGTSVGALAALVLSTSALYLGVGRLVLVDMTFSILLAGAVLLLAARIGDGEGPPPAVAYLLLGAAAVVKGPVALVLFAGTVALHAISSPDRRPPSGLWLMPGLALSVAVALPWYVVSWHENPEYLSTFFWRGHVLRFLSPERAGGREPLLYYAYVLPAAALPWSLSWPAALRARAPKPVAASAHRFLVCSGVVVVGFFSFSRTKLPTYVLPALPSLSLLYARRLMASDLFDAGAAAGRLLCAATVVWAGLLLLAPPLGAFLLPPDYRAAVFAVAITAVGAGPALAAISYRGTRNAWIGATAGSVVVLAGCGLIFASPMLAMFKSGVGPGRIVAEHLPPHGRIGTYQFRSNGLRFYSGRVVQRLESVPAAAAMLASPEPAVVALRTWHRHELPRYLSGPAYVWWGQWETHRVLLANVPLPGAATQIVLAPAIQPPPTQPGRPPDRAFTPSLPP
jgi:4-amino-4-deoxy-L-arabinose transferase-like glycosyltransferase